MELPSVGTELESFTTEPWYITEVDQVHNSYCGCWECNGRIPDNLFVFPMDNPVIGKCAYCGDYITANEGIESVHYICWDDFAAYLNSPEGTFNA